MTIHEIAAEIARRRNDFAGDCAENVETTVLNLLSQLEPKLAPTSMTATELLLGLVDMTNHEAFDGRWRVVLEYDNYHDVAMVKDGNECVVSGCADINLTPNQQFLKAVELAVLKTRSKA